MQNAGYITTGVLSPRKKSHSEPEPGISPEQSQRPASSSALPRRPAETWNKPLADHPTPSFDPFFSTSPSGSSTAFSSMSSWNEINNRSSQSSSSHTQRHDFGGSQSVLAFLNACMPPMGHLLDRFLESGCNSEEYVLGVSLWEAGQVEEFLRRLPPDVNGKRLSLMEILTLKNYWKAHFV